MLEKYPGMENGGISADPLLKNLSVCYILWKRNHMTGPEPCGARKVRGLSGVSGPGAAGGRGRKVLRGRETRPTTDRVKEGIFNIIQFDIEGRRVLDLFAGTGQLGIEALSRGAARAVFVEQRRDAAALVRENLKITGLGENARVVNGEALAFLASCGEKCDLIFLDPPYAAELWDSALEAISRFDILSNHGIIICESPAERVMPELAPPYRVHRTYRYGRIKVTTYHREEGDEA